MNTAVRLNKFLARAGLGSRRAVERLIAGGEVRVNGKVITSPAYMVTPDLDVVVFRGNPIHSTDYLTYLMLNKPAGYVTTASDEKGRKTVFHLVHVPVRVFPVGRLDRDSEGLLLLTNDGDLAHRLLHPRWKVEKKYFVMLDRRAEREVATAFARGVVIDRRYRVRGALRFPDPKDTRLCEVTITEGRNRQIRKMFSACGYKVKGLRRLAIGPLQLGRLQAGDWRYLSNAELYALKKAIGLTHGNSE